MKAKLIYEEGKKDSGYWGKEESSETVIEVDGNFYKIIDWKQPYSRPQRKMQAIDFSLEDLPEEYEEGTREGTSHSSLRHGNGQEIEVDLTSFTAGYVFPEKLEEQRQREGYQMVQEYTSEKFEQDPSLNYRKIIEEMNVEDDIRSNAEIIVNAIEKEIMEDKERDLEFYRPIIENLQAIAEGKAVVLVHKNGYYSKPEDSLITLKNITENSQFLNFGNYSPYEEPSRRTELEVFSLERKKGIDIGKGITYIGSHWVNNGRYCIDFHQVAGGDPYIIRNVYESWANSQDFSETINTSLPIDRFDISTGEEEGFESYNAEVRQRRALKRDFFRGVMEEAKQVFNISEDQARILLDFAGTVSALNIATDFEKGNLSTDQALAILRKTSHQGMAKVLYEAGIEYPAHKFDAIQSAAETLAYIHTLKEPSQERTNNSRLTPLREELRRANVEKAEISKAMAEISPEPEKPNKPSYGED